jgi:hypothetical protein
MSIRARHSTIDRIESDTGVQCAGRPFRWTAAPARDLADAVVDLRRTACCYFMSGTDHGGGSWAAGLNRRNGRLWVENGSRRRPVLKSWVQNTEVRLDRVARRDAKLDGGHSVRLARHWLGADGRNPPREMNQPPTLTNLPSGSLALTSHPPRTETSPRHHPPVRPQRRSTEPGSAPPPPFRRPRSRPDYPFGNVQ